MKHLFVLNPAAGGKKNRFKETERTLREYAAGLVEPVEVYITKAPRDAITKVAAESELCDKLYVYACGGDGTLNECVCGAAGRDNVAVTHYPCGTGNDFIKMFGKKDMAKFRDLAALTGGVVRPVDLIDCNGRVGINICSVGIDARIGADVHKYSAIPIIGGATAYVVSLFFNVIRGVNMFFKVTINGETESGEYSLMCACNGRFYGGGFNPVPDARLDDGTLDFLIIGAVTRIKLLAVVGKYAKGRYRELGELVTFVRGSSMKIQAENEFVVNIDGESVYTDNIAFRVIPGGVNFIFPEKMEFFDDTAMDTTVKSSK